MKVSIKLMIRHALRHGGHDLHSGLRHGGFRSPATHPAVRWVPPSTPTIKSVSFYREDSADIE
jgi:hypothetical protein